MLKIISVVLIAVTLTGCGAFDRQIAGLTGYSKSCVDGVTYLQFVSGVTPQYTIDGKLVACK